MKMTQEQLETMARIAKANPEVIEIARKWTGAHGRCPAGGCRGSLECSMYCDQVIKDRPITTCPCELLGNDVTRSIRDQFFEFMEDKDAK